MNKSCTSHKPYQSQEPPKPRTTDRPCWINPERVIASRQACKRSAFVVYCDTHFKTVDGRYLVQMPNNPAGVSWGGGWMQDMDREEFWQCTSFKENKKSQ